MVPKSILLLFTLIQIIALVRSGAPVDYADMSFVEKFQLNGGFSIDATEFLVINVTVPVVENEVQYYTLDNLDAEKPFFNQRLSDCNPAFIPGTFDQNKDIFCLSKNVTIDPHVKTCADGVSPCRLLTISWENHRDLYDMLGKKCTVSTTPQGSQSLDCHIRLMVGSALHDPIPGGNQWAQGSFASQLVTIHIELEHENDFESWTIHTQRVFQVNQQCEGEMTVSALLKKASDKLTNFRIDSQDPKNLNGLHLVSEAQIGPTLYKAELKGLPIHGEVKNALAKVEADYLQEYLPGKSKKLDYSFHTPYGGSCSDSCDIKSILDFKMYLSTSLNNLDEIKSPIGLNDEEFVSVILPESYDPETFEWVTAPDDLKFQIEATAGTFVDYQVPAKCIRELTKAEIKAITPKDKRFAFRLTRSWVLPNADKTENEKCWSMIQTNRVRIKCRMKVKRRGNSLSGTDKHFATGFIYSGESSHEKKGKKPIPLFVWIIIAGAGLIGALVCGVGLISFFTFKAGEKKGKRASFTSLE